jgi:predicted ATP-dependent endonuclease of OLD family
MQIERLHMKNFKRFSDLTIDLSSLQTPPKLVLMIGANRGLDRRFGQGGLSRRFCRRF